MNADRVDRFGSFARWLTRPWGEHTKRSDTDPLGSRYSGEGNRPIVEAVQRIAEARGVPMAQVALAWVLHNPVVAAPIVGPTNPHHLPDAAAALGDKRAGNSRPEADR